MKIDWGELIFRAFLIALTVLMFAATAWLALTIFWPHHY